MRRRFIQLLWVAVLACPGVISCTPAASKAADRPTTQRSLPEPADISGVPCRDFARTYTDGGVAACRLAREWSYRGQVLPAGTVVSLAPGGELDHCFLPGDTMIQGHVCRGHGYDFMTTFHANGRLAFCNLASDETIDGVPCRRWTFLADVLKGEAGVHFHDNGRLDHCLLAEDATITGNALRKKDRVRFDREGQLVAN